MGHSRPTIAVMNNIGRLLAELLLAILFFYMFFPGALQSAYPTPVWFGEEVYVEYRSQSNGVMFVNGSLDIFDEPVEVSSYWKCVKFEDDVAELKVTVIYGGKTNITLSAHVYVNLENRDVTSLDGKLIGKTCLWLHPYPKEGDAVVLLGKPPNYITGTVSEVKGSMKTPQGYQKIFFADAEVNGVPVSGGYDLDTGLLISRPIQGDGTLLALGLWDLGFLGAPSIAATNIDLGPRTLWPEIVTAMFVIVPIASFFVIFIAIYRRRARRVKKPRVLRR